MEVLIVLMIIFGIIFGSLGKQTKRRGNDNTQIRKKNGRFG